MSVAEVIRASVGGSLPRLSVTRRIVGLISITWLPMCVLAIAQGNAIASTPRASFLLDFATYARFFVAAPLLVLAELVIRPRMTETCSQFVRTGFVRSTDQHLVERALDRLTRRRDSRWATVLLLALAIFGAWNLTVESLRGDQFESWQTVSASGNDAVHHSLAGFWNHLIALPIVLFLFYRWVWRILVWTLFLRSVARLDLQLVPAHADGAGGLGFLEIVPRAFGLLAFGVTSIVSADIAFSLVYEHGQLSAFTGPLLVLLVVLEVIFLCPLLVFTPVMLRARYRGLREYGDLVVRYNRDFQRKWIERTTREEAPLLGSADIQSLADVGNSFQFVRRMRLVPFGLDTALHLTCISALPLVPLLVLAMPLTQIFHVLTKLMF